MMINHNGQDYRVRFSYHHNNKFGGQALAKLKGKRIVTQAIVSKDFEGNWVDIAVGRSVRDPRDQFNKATGRRRALQAAMSPKNPTLMNKLHPIDAETRLDIWDRYFDLHRDGVDLMIGDFEKV